MKIKMILTLVLSLMLLVFTSPAQAVPLLPHSFYGEVEINDAPAPDGTAISAKVDSGTIVRGAPVRNPIPTIDGSYEGLLVYGLIPDGTTIHFYINDVDTGSTAIYESGGGPDKIDLYITVKEKEEEGEVIIITCPCCGEKLEITVKKLDN